MHQTYALAVSIVTGMRYAPNLLSLPFPPTSCSPTSTYVTVLSNESYVPGALCLRHSLRLAGSRCNIVLVLDDLERNDTQSGFQRRTTFSSEVTTRLLAAYGADSVLHLTDLYGRMLNYSQHHSLNRSIVTGARENRRFKSSSGTGRRLRSASYLSRLPRAHSWGSKTHQKLLVWALPGYHRAAFLDLDLLVTGNPDALLSAAPFSAVAALPYSTKVFNSGVFVFKPSLKTAALLYDLSRRATFSRVAAVRDVSDAATAPVRIVAALEKFHLTDQSILNHHFRGRWNPLPFGFNAGVKIRSVDRRLWTQIQSTIIHFVASPKPWEVTRFDPTTTEHVHKAGIWPLHMLWRRQCNFTLELHTS